VEQYAQVNKQIIQTDAVLADASDALDCDVACSLLLENLP
jgi:hypothetical protein